MQDAIRFPNRKENNNQIAFFVERNRKEIASYGTNASRIVNRIKGRQRGIMNVEEK